MAAIYLRHPVHGEKVATGDLEADYDRSNGWVDFDPTQPTVPSFLAPSESNLPPDFPGREALIEAGLTKWDNIIGKTNEELQKIKGIGAVTAQNILKVMDS